MENAFLLLDVPVNQHRLNDGTTIIVTSTGHGFQFSDGSSCGPQHKELCDMLTCQRISRKVAEVKGHTFNETRMILSDGQLDFLGKLCEVGDIVMIAFPVLSALREMGVRDRFPNAVAMNATPETRRAAPADKVVDVDNWSY